MKISTTETVHGEGGALKQAGTYHVVVNKVAEGESIKGTPIDGLTVVFEVMGGTSEGQQGKTHTESFFLPTLQDTKPEMKLRRFTAMAIAGNVLKPEQLGTDADIPFIEMIGHQMLVKFNHQMEKDGNGDYTIETEYLQVAYSDLFHVDDPAVKDIPKNADALSIIPKEHRHNAEWFAWKKKKPTAKRATVAAGAASSGVDDLF